MFYHIDIFFSLYLHHPNSDYNLTGQRGPPVEKILGLNGRSGTNSFLPVLVLLPRSVLHSTYSLSPSVLGSPSQVNCVVKPKCADEDLRGVVSELLFFPQYLHVAFTETLSFICSLNFPKLTEFFSLPCQGFS